MIKSTPYDTTTENHVMESYYGAFPAQYEHITSSESLATKLPECGERGLQIAMANKTSQNPTKAHPSEDHSDKDIDALMTRANEILRTANIAEKVCKTETLVREWKNRSAEPLRPSTQSFGGKIPDHPSRPQGVAVVKSSKVKQGNRVAFIHGVAHAESYAIDLMWDIICRFRYERMPVEFYDDFVRIAGEEGIHYSRWANRLIELGSHYGALATHESLWQSASETVDNLYERLAIVHMVHEARGLDVYHIGLGRLEQLGDDVSSKILRTNVEDEITHVAAAVKWFKYLCERDNANPVTTFHDMVRKKYRGTLKPPFNHEARSRAGMTAAWYEPLASRKAS